MRHWKQLALAEGCTVIIVCEEECLVGLDLNPAGDLASTLEEGNPLLVETGRQLAAYFDGRLDSFDLPLRIIGTDFQQRCWRALLTIPYGETRSYGEMAKQIGNPEAVRAVGAANGQNPLPIVVPCHRVIGRDGKLVGFGGGLPLKRLLLDLEARHAGLFRQAKA